MNLFISEQEQKELLKSKKFIIIYSTRGVEIGTLLADRDPETGLDRIPEMELLRLAIPRRVYSLQHMDYVAVTLAKVMERSLKITTGFTIEKQAAILRHFTVELSRV